MRASETIVYNTLNKNDVLKIVDLQLLDLYQNLEKIGLSLTVTKRSKDLLIEKGFNEEFGVRFLNREIQNLLENPLSELLLRKSFNNVKGIKIDAIKSKFKFLPIKPRASNKKLRKKSDSKSKKSIKN